MIEAQSPLNLSASTSPQQYPEQSPGLPREKAGPLPAPLPFCAHGQS